MIFPFFSHHFPWIFAVIGHFIFPTSSGHATQRRLPWCGVVDGGLGGLRRAVLLRLAGLHAHGLRGFAVDLLWKIVVGESMGIL